MKRREAVRWFLATAPLAPLAAVAYLLFEWLFIVTKPSPTAALPFAEQLIVLVASPVPILWPLYAVQAVASAVAAAVYPRLRNVALLPAAVVLGLLLLVLIDNFTYTVFGFGILNSNAVVRLLYAALLPALVVFAGWKVAALAVRLAATRALPAAAAALACALAALPAFWSDPPPPPADELGLPPLPATSRASRQLPNVLLLGIDGLDAEFLSAYGYERRTTPFLESIREDTLFFENAFSNATRTHGSIVALLTGRLPFRTRVTFPPTVLQGSDGYKNLPALLKQQGYTTLQIGMRHYADAADVNLFGFDAANYRWEELDDVGEGAAPAPGNATAVFRDTVEERLAERLGHLFGARPAADGFAHVQGTRQSEIWRDERRVRTLTRYFAQAGEPWFVHLHLLDTHCCRFQPRQAHFAGDGLDRAWVARDSQIRETDDHVRRLFEALEQTGRLERTIVVINSDHASQWKATERVPLMIRFPGRTPRGRIAANAQAVDVAPTVLDYLKVPVPEWMDGQSLLAAQQLPPDRPIFGVSDITGREGAEGARVLTDGGGPPNYGVAAAMLIRGNRWFELRLDSGAVRSGLVRGHTGQAASGASEDQARLELGRLLNDTGFRVASPTP